VLQHKYRPRWHLSGQVSRLDRSMSLKTTDYVALAKPRLERIVARRRTPEVVDGS